MTQITPPHGPILPQPVVQIGLPATVVSPPAGAQNANIGSRMPAQVIERNDQGQVVVSTPLGDMILQTKEPLRPGMQLTLQITENSAHQMQVVLLANKKVTSPQTETHGPHIEDTAEGDEIVTSKTASLMGNSPAKPLQTGQTYSALLIRTPHQQLPHEIPQQSTPSASLASGNSEKSDPAIVSPLLLAQEQSQTTASPIKTGTHLPKAYGPAEGLTDTHQQQSLTLSSANPFKPAADSFNSDKIFHSTQSSQPQPHHGEPIAHQPSPTGQMTSPLPTAALPDTSKSMPPGSSLPSSANLIDPQESSTNQSSTLLPPHDRSAFPAGTSPLNHHFSAPHATPVMPEKIQVRILQIGANMPTDLSKNAMTGHVIGQSPDKLPIIQTPIGHVIINSTPLPIGETIQYQFVWPQDSSATSTSEAGKVSQTALNQSLQNLIGHIADQEISSPSINTLLNLLPKTGGNPASILLFFLAERLGTLPGQTQINRDLLFETPLLRNMLGQIKDNIKKSDHSTENTNGWSSVTVPLRYDQNILPVMFHWHRMPHEQQDNADRSQDNPQRKRNKRFLVELQLSWTGRLQFDGLVKDQHLDLILRTEKPFPVTLQNEIQNVFHHTNEVYGLNGQLSFQHTQQFIDITQHDGNHHGPHHPGHNPVLV